MVAVSWSPAPARSGDGLLFTATVRNVGTDPTPEVTHGVAFLVDGTKVSWSAGDSAPLGPGEERTYPADGGPESATWTATPGEHQLEVQVDDVARIPETDDGNNTLTTTLGVGD